MTRKKESIPRAEMVRSRRSQNQTSEGPGRKFETSTRQMPPVMVRGSGYISAPQPGSKRKPKAPKRRYDIALASPGVEMRLPSIPMVKLGWRALSFVLVIGLVALLYSMWTSPTFQVQMVDVKGASRLTASDINRSLNIYNQPIFTIIPNQLANHLMANYRELLDVAVKISLPAKVIVTINERTPLIEWTQESLVQWIDGDGFAFPTRGQVAQLVKVQAYASPPKPAVTLEDDILLDTMIAPKAFMTSELVNGILTMRAQAPANSNLVYDPTYGLGWSDSRGWDVYFGSDVAEIETKLRVYQAVVDKLQTEGITPALINVEHVHAPYYRMEP